MERDILSQLVTWKNRNGRKPLLITGVRQCGKTYVMKEFGKTYFENTAYFNFEGNIGLASVFEFDFDTDRILDELGNIVSNCEIIPGKTLLIFDEIQECSKAITSLKYFCENKPELHIVCAGSLLGVAIKRENISFPVGKVDRVQMYPMNFSEFVRADGGEWIYRGLEKIQAGRALPDLYRVPLEKLLKLYYIIGGMPEAVAKWVETHHFEEVEKIQDNILQDYGSDFSKHAPVSEIPKLGWLWESIPKQLAKENNKFVFSHVKEGKRAKDLENGLEWLKDAGLIYRLELVAKPELPLAFCADATYFKVYMADVGLLRRRAGISYRTIIQGADEFVRFKGALTENFVLTELIAYGKIPYFWRSENSAEVDFLFEQENSIIPVEAKAEDNTRAKSYRQFCKKYHSKKGIKLSMKNVGTNRVENTVTYSIPLYLIWKLEEYLEEKEEIVMPQSKTGELKDYGEKELAEYMLRYIDAIEKLMNEIEPIIHHEKEADTKQQKMIQAEYKRLKDEIRKDVHYVGLKKNQMSVCPELYSEIVVPSMKEAGAYGFSAAVNAKIDYNYWGALAEAKYKLTKYYSKTDWERLRYQSELKSAQFSSPKA